jgi:hypothetical protein
MVRNPTYGMDAMEQANYTLALRELEFAQDAALQTGTEINTTTNLMNYLAMLGDPNFTTAVLEEIRGVIDIAPGMVTKGLTDENVLHALGELSRKQAPDGTYPYRDMFAIVQGMGMEDLLSAGTTDETTQAIKDAAAAAAPAAGGGGATFIPGGGEFGYDTVVAPVPAGQQPANASQSSYHYEEGSPIAFYLNDGRPVYEDSDGKTYVVRDKSEKYVKEGDKAWEFSYRWVPQRVYRGDNSYWPADQEWPNPIRQG